MFRRIFDCIKVSPTPPQDVQTESEPCKPQSVDNNTRGSKKIIGCRFWMRHLFGCVPKKDRPPPSKSSPERSFFCLPRCCIRKQRVGPSLVLQKNFDIPKSKAKIQPKPKAKPKSKAKPELNTKFKVKLTEKNNNNKIPSGRIGLPNIGNTCYLNACLQSLMTLDQFMVMVRDQESVWRQSHEAGLLRHLQAIADAHSSPGEAQITTLLHNFKQAVASKAPEFQGKGQKDAHEFLTAVMDQIQSLAPKLESFASSLGTTYTCPVKQHMRFNMERTRTCTGCGMATSRREVFTNLSLDLFPGWSTERLLEHHLKETELEFRCECGGTISSQKAAFASLPNVLILHLKRFTYNSKFRSEKVTCPIHLSRDIVVPSKEDAGCFSLVSVMSHLGNSADHGHYICDGLDPEDDPSEPTDKWLTFDDTRVCPSPGRDCCRKREMTAYILFYKRIMV